MASKLDNIEDLLIIDQPLMYEEFNEEEEQEGNANETEGVGEDQHKQAEDNEDEEVEEDQVEEIEVNPERVVKNPRNVRVSLRDVCKKMKPSTAVLRNSLRKKPSRKVRTGYIDLIIIYYIFPILARTC